ncbi:MAG: asparaginase domain-containing protein [Clostridia bacterium]|nr:asparaginase domain-containing protein [Clostridia bacterium]
MTKILLLLTGGTIGSIMTDGVISTDKDKKCRLIELYNQKYNDDCVFDIKQPLNILSENLDKSHWEILVNTILETDISSYDGIIITHGSDTLSYSSAMLSMCLCHLEIPVIITASNYVPDDTRSNALINIHSAVILIKTLERGIFTVFANEGDDFCSVYLPTRINEADRFNDKFSSFDGMCFGTVKNNTFVKNPLSPSLYEIYKKRQPITNRLSLKKDVLMIRPYPSMNYSSINLNGNIGAVLHITYHSSTAKTDGENSALAFLEKCKKADIDFYCASFKDKNSALYETSNILIKNDAIPLYNISNESAYAKLLLCYNCDISDKKSIYGTEYLF